MKRLLIAAAMCVLGSAAHAQCYVNGGVGASMVNTEVSAGPLSLDGVGASGGVATARVGCDAIIGNARLGAFAEYAFRDVSFKVEPSLFSAKFGNSWGVGARAGYRVMNAMPYLLLAYQQQEMSWSIPIDAPTFRGVKFGGGIEFDLDKNWALGLEFTQTRFASESVLGVVNLQPVMNEGTARLAYRF